MKDCLRKRGLDVRQTIRMVQDRCEWQSFVRECMRHSLGDEPLTLTRCHSCGLSQLYEACGWKFVCGLKRKILFFLKLCFFFYCSSFYCMMRADPAVAGGGYSIINIFTYLFIYFIIKE